MNKTGATRVFRLHMNRALLCVVLAVTLVSPVWAAAAKRVVQVQVPTKVAPGEVVEVSVTASTDAGAGEQIGFLHAEYSVDGGKTWTAFCYESNAGPSLARVTQVTAGSAGSTLTVRARVAFRGGVAGDVDFNGAAIRWEDHWHNWSEPPARSVSVKVSGS